MAKIGFYLLLAPLYIISLLPLKVLYLISDFFAFFLRVIMRYRSDVVTTNISRSFPRLNYKEINKISKGFYHNFSDVFIELVWSVSASKKSYCSKVKVENAAELRPFHDQGKSVLIVMGHQANWENLAVLDTSSSGYSNSDFRIVYKKMRSKTSDLLIKWIREHNKECEYVESNEIARYMIKHRNEQLIYILLADQAPLPGAKFVVNFLNQPTLMLNGPELLSKKHNIPVAFVNSTRESRGKYSARIAVITEDPSKEDDGAITRKFASLLEAGIELRPSDWLWSHKRWKRSVN